MYLENNFRDILGYQKEKKNFLNFFNIFQSLSYILVATVQNNL